MSRKLNTNAANRVELANNFVELERAREKFNFTYLPEESEPVFREALSFLGYEHWFQEQDARDAMEKASPGEKAKLQAKALEETLAAGVDGLGPRFFRRASRAAAGSRRCQRRW